MVCEQPGGSRSVRFEGKWRGLTGLFIEQNGSSNGTLNLWESKKRETQETENGRLVRCLFVAELEDADLAVGPADEETERKTRMHRSRGLIDWLGCSLSGLIFFLDVDMRSSLVPRFLSLIFFFTSLLLFCFLI
jgi:hypothetical protein